MKSVLLLLTVLFVQSVEAGIMPASSRMIYRDGDREKTLMLVNTNDYPVLVQSWVDNGEGSPEAASPPPLWCCHRFSAWLRDEHRDCG